MRIGIAGYVLSESGQNPIFQANLAQRLQTIPKIIVYYLQTFFFPVNLAILQDWIVEHRTINDFYFPFAIVVAFFVLILAGAIILRKRNSEQFRIYRFFFLWFIAGLAFHSQLFPLDMTVADRWFYFPMVGLLGMIAVAVQKLKNAPVWLGIFIVLFSIRTIARTFDWRDNLTLFSRDARGSSSANLEFNLAAALLKAKRVDEAKIHIARAADLAESQTMKAYYQGTLAMVEGNKERAKAYYMETIRIGDSPLAYAALANIIYQSGSLEEALTFTNESLKKQPVNAQLWLNLALLEYEQGNQEKALAAAQKAYELSPTTDGLYILGQIEQRRPIYK